MYENAKLAMKVVADRRLVSRGMLGLMMVLVWFVSNDSRLKLWEGVDWMVCCSNSNNFH